MERKQITLFATLFVIVVAVLALGYFLFLQPGYSVLYEDVREADAAEIVAVLDQQGIAYRLEDGGHRILVPDGEVGQARVLVAGSGVAMGGVVGFELFNETDMGLTEFAQKVNYQRALQGELARTIMAMEGIRFARVHLSLPERTLFRSDKTSPKAAVTVQSEHNGVLDSARVAGIQQLVSSSVTDLPIKDVVILDHKGRLLTAPPTSNADQPVELDEREALEEYYRARIRSLTRQLIPGVAFNVSVLAIDRQTLLPDEDTVAESSNISDATDRNFSLRITLRTESELSQEDSGLLRNAISQTTALQPDQGDTLRFDSGPIEQAERPVTTAPLALGKEEQSLAPSGSSNRFKDWSAEQLIFNKWFWFGLAGLAVLITLLMRQRSRMSGEDQQNFADMLSENLAMREGARNGG